MQYNVPSRRAAVPGAADPAAAAHAALRARDAAPRLARSASGE